MLCSGETDRLNARLTELSSVTGAQMAVLLLENHHVATWRDPAEQAQAAGTLALHPFGQRTWGVGRANHNDGVVLHRSARAATSRSSPGTARHTLKDDWLKRMQRSSWCRCSRRQGKGWRRAGDRPDRRPAAGVWRLGAGRDGPPTASPKSALAAGSANVHHLHNLQDEALLHWEAVRTLLASTRTQAGAFTPSARLSRSSCSPWSRRSCTKTQCIRNMKMRGERERTRALRAPRQKRPPTPAPSSRRRRSTRR